MKKYTALIAIVAGLLSACSAEVDSKKSDDAPKPVKQNSPTVQTLQVGTEETPSSNNIIIHKHKEGAIERLFTYKVTTKGLLYIDFPFTFYSDCDLTNTVDIFKFETLKSGAVIKSVILENDNRYQSVLPGYDYQVRVNLLNLGVCEYMNLIFNASFTE